MGLIFPWWGNFLHRKHRSWKSNIPLWQQWGEVMNNLRFYALASPSLRKQSVYCLGKQFENMFIAVVLATRGGRRERGRGGGGGWSHTLPPAVSFSLEGYAHRWGRFSRDCRRSGGFPRQREHLLSLSSRGERRSFEISPVCLRSKIYLAGGDGLSITISKILFLRLFLRSSVSPTWNTVKRDRGFGLSLKAGERVTKAYLCAKLQKPVADFFKGDYLPTCSGILASVWAQIIGTFTANS